MCEGPSQRRMRSCSTTTSSAPLPVARRRPSAPAGPSASAASTPPLTIRHAARRRHEVARAPRRARLAPRPQRRAVRGRGRRPAAGRDVDRHRRRHRRPVRAHRLASSSCCRSRPRAARPAAALPAVVDRARRGARCPRQPERQAAARASCRPAHGRSRPRPQGVEQRIGQRARAIHRDGGPHPAHRAGVAQRPDGDVVAGRDERQRRISATPMPDATIPMIAL